MPSENRSQHISELGAKVIDIEKKTRKIEAEMKADVQMLSANGMRTEREMRKIRSNVLIDKQSVGVLNKTLRSIGIGVSAMASGVKNSSNFMKEYAMAAEEFRLNKQNVAALAISSIAGAPVGYFASKIFETETVKNLMSTIKSKSGDLIKRALRRNKAKTGGEEDDFNEIPRMQKGGYVKKGGYAKLHAAEVVMPVEKLLRELQEQRKLNTTTSTNKSQMAKDIAAIARSTADTSKAIKSMSRGSLNLERNMVRALDELKVAMIGTTDQWRIKMQSALLRHPVIKKFMTINDMIKTFMSTPLKWLFGKRGGYEGLAGAAQNTDNVFEKSSNLLSLIFRYQMPRLDKIINILQAGFEGKLKKKGDKKLLEKSEEDEITTMAGTIKKWLEGKHKAPTMWERFVESEYVGLETDDLEKFGVGGFKDLAHPSKMTTSMGLTRENIERKMIAKKIHALKLKLKVTKDPKKKQLIMEQIRELSDKAHEAKRAKKAKAKEKEAASMNVGGVVTKTGYIKAHAAEVIMPIEKVFNRFFGGKTQAEKNQAKINRTMKTEEVKEFGKTIGEGIASTGNKYFGGKTTAEKNQAKIERKWKLHLMKESVKEKKEWAKYRLNTSKNLGTIKEKSTEQVKKTNEVVKEIKEMGGGFFTAIGGILSGLAGMVGSIASTALGSMATIGGGILGTLGLKKLGGKLAGAGKTVQKGSGFLGTLKGGFKVGAAVPAGIGAIAAGGTNLAAKGAKNIVTGLGSSAKQVGGFLGNIAKGGKGAGIGKAVSGIAGSAASMIGKGGMFALKGIGKGLLGTAGLGLGLGAGAIAGVGKGAHSLLKAAGRSPYLAGIMSLYDAYSMSQEHKEMGVSKGSAGMAGLLSSGREGGLGQGIWGMFKGAGLGGLVGGIVGSVIFPGVGTAVGAAMGAKIGTVAGGAMGWLGGNKIAKAIDKTVTTIADSMGMIKVTDENKDSLIETNDDPNALARELNDSGRYNKPEPTAAEEIDRIKAYLKNPDIGPQTRKYFEEKLAALEPKARNALFTSRIWDKKEGAETKTYKLTELERLAGVPMVSVKDRKPVSVSKEWVGSSGSSKALSDKLADRDAEKAKELKKVGKDIVQPMVEQMDIAQKSMDKSNKMMANTIMNSSNQISNTITNNSSVSGGQGGGMGLGAGAGDISRVLFANMS